MAKLILSQAGKPDKDILLEKDRTTLGRRPDNDIPLQEGTVSGAHAVITKLADDSFEVEDQNSTNGTFVNGQRITKQALNSGDILQLGQLRMIFSQSSSVGSDSTMVLSPGSLAGGRMVAVKFMSGPNSGQVKMLDGKTAVRVGTRGTSMAEVSRFGDDCYITYTGGAQLPKVNGKKIGIEKTLLNSRDVVEVGPDKLEVLVE
ncbi:MAG: FHA domain-containing protein [Gammaproteobacteria bacterium]|nr:FHA domain-containing protein [Gammaproteobacteria bacterium]